MKNNLSTRQQQTTNIIMITFWSQFSTYALNTILILFLTRPMLAHGLGYNQAKAYAFIGISQATGYLMPILGGFMADNVLGIRRSILLGSILLALAYLLVMLSGYTIDAQGDVLFIAAFALIPAANSLLIGTASGMVSHIYNDDAIKAKSAMTFYYMAINVGALLATIVSPTLLDSRYGPLSVLTLTFVGKSIAALNFAYRYRIYDSVIWGKDKLALSLLAKYRIVGYLLVLYLFTLFAYSHIVLASIIITIGCGLGIFWFLIKTVALSGASRYKQLVASVLILEAIVFFVIYNQMNSTLILFAKNNSNSLLFGFAVSPAHYQMLNPLLIIALGLQLPRFYQLFPRFSIPYQFASGTLLAGSALLIMAYAATHAENGLVNGNYIGLTYILISLAELWVSAIGLSMIGLYCDNQALAFAMGVWYLACSLSSALSGSLASWVAIPETMTSPLESLPIYQQYYLWMGLIACLLGACMLILAHYAQRLLRRRGIILA
jgi:POT family proton-dependent oligopeptide transporter